MLKLYQVPAVSVDLGNGGEPLVLHALSTTDVFALFRGYREELAAFYDTIIALQVAGKIDLAEVPALAATMLKNVPSVAAHAIALAAWEDDDEARRVAGLLPFPVQLDALEKIFRLTFSGTEAVKKALEAVIHYSEGTAGLLNPLLNTPDRQRSTK